MIFRVDGRAILGRVSGGIVLSRAALKSASFLFQPAVVLRYAVSQFPKIRLSNCFMPFHLQPFAMAVRSFVK